jgi:CheY-like chemotaxis protein/predicted regulator of Ras-like GTPase activity (Roadblock/LC7/MglB family)
MSINSKRKRVLIVDDEESVAIVLAAGLSRANHYDVDTANSGAAALAKFKAHPFDLVLTDYRMPDMSGIELSEKIRQLRPNTLIMLMTAYDSRQVREQTKTSNLNEYIQKPIPVAQVRSIVEKALAQTLAKSVEPASAAPVSADVNGYVRKLRLDTQADCVLLLRAAGHLVMMDGATQNLDVNSIGALIAANFMAATELARLLGNQSIFKSSFHEGPDYDIYAYDVNGDFLLAVIFGRGSKAGLVRHYTQETAVSLLPLLAQLLEVPVDYFDDSTSTVDQDFDELFGLVDEVKELFSVEKAREMGLIK